MSDIDTELNTDILDSLIRTLKKSSGMTVKVGVFQSTDARTDGGSNIEIGTIHEYGAPGANIPMRSFLRVPLAEKLPNAIDKHVGITEAKLAEVVSDKSLEALMEDIAQTAVNIVKESFDTGGDGKWPPHAPGYTNRTGQLLKDTTQLKQSITYEIKK